VYQLPYCCGPLLCGFHVAIKGLIKVQTAATAAAAAGKFAIHRIQQTRLIYCIDSVTRFPSRGVVVIWA